MATEELKFTRLKVGDIEIDLAKQGTRYVGGIIYKGDNKGDINFKIIREFPIKISFERFVRNIPKERFLDLYKVIGKEIRESKGGKKPAKKAVKKPTAKTTLSATPAAATARKSKAKKRPKSKRTKK